MLKMTLRTKLILFSVILALIPVAIAGWNMIKITRDEVKSTANNELSSVAEGVANDIDNFFLNNWGTPLLLIRDAVDNKNLGTEQKIEILQLGLYDFEDIVALQIALEGDPQPYIYAQEKFTDNLIAAGLDPVEILLLPPEKTTAPPGDKDIVIEDLVYVEKVDSWLMTIRVKLHEKLLDRKATLFARVNLARLRNDLTAHPFGRLNQITLIEPDGQAIFDSARTDLAHLGIVGAMIDLMTGDNKLAGVHHYERPDGAKMLGAYAFPTYFDWGVFVEKKESDAYTAVAKMTGALFLWVVVGIVIAVVTSVVVSLSLTKPLLRLTRAARTLATGDFTVQIEGGDRSDEIGELSNAFIKMVSDLQRYIYELTETTKQKERVESELKLARNIQQSFIPKQFPLLNNLEFYGLCDPAREVGGDFIDYIKLNENTYGFVIGDVSGKGVPAALFVSMCRTLFRLLSARLKDPQKVLDELNNKLIEFDPSGNLFITLFYGIYDLRSGKFTYSNAGHNMPFAKIIKTAELSEELTMLPRMKTLVAGMFEDIPLETAELFMSPGDSIVFYTDGMTEAVDMEDNEFGEERFRQLLSGKLNQSAQEICEEAIKEVKEYQTGRPQFDDMTMFVIKVK